VPVPTATAEERKAACCCKQEEGAQRRIAPRLRCTGAGECRASVSVCALETALTLPPSLPGCPPRPLRPCLGVHLGRCIPALTPRGAVVGAVAMVVPGTPVVWWGGRAGPLPGIAASPHPERSACREAIAPPESSLIYTQKIYFKSAFLARAFVLLYCNVSA